MKLKKPIAVRVLGRYSPYPPKNGNCSGYLLTIENKKILFDCGNGILSNLQNYFDVSELSAVFISHFHEDHVADLVALRHAYETSIKMGNATNPLAIYVPRKPQEQVDKLSSYEGFDVKALEENDHINIGEIDITCIKTEHPLYCLAYRLEYNDKIFAYTGDTAYKEDSSLIDFISNSDLLLAETSFTEKNKKGHEDYHMSAKEAALLAKNANVKRLIMTHLHPLIDTKELLNEASKVFSDSSLAVENTSYLI
ncbi:MBL fold metallo-hydrolase [Natranaerobius trueperi]|uniref:Metallo-beta-lactamase domain-containing protein n=1 Tax=Natranaerobius trueperi TaxID=759412 RepID=A0A226C0D4_9FIRM|nr:MBL fold metallo-hydrolase [Natranaerobius trueperi]OWZ84758.1 hypothetical protein CDO51_01690 [Natranaerobius trueperi]